MGKMNFEEFTKTVADKVKDFLGNHEEDVSVEIMKVNKNNGLELVGLSIKTSNSNIAPTIYLEQFYEKYKNGLSMDDVVEKIAEAGQQQDIMETFDVPQLTDFSKVKNRLIPRIVNSGWNMERLKSAPYVEIADLAVTYHILFKHSETGERSASVMVTNDLMNTWGVDVETIHKIAVENMKRLLPSRFVSMGTMLRPLLEGDDVAIQGMENADVPMYVLTNMEGMHGAAAILDKDVMNSVKEKFGDQFFVIPSSLHEVLIIRGDTADKDTLNLMIREVNETQVAREDWLSDHVYMYTEEGLCAA